MENWVTQLPKYEGKMKFKEIAHVRLYESVIEQIMNLIATEELKFGDRIPPERELAEKLSISRGSLREAFRVLESRGLIESKPGGGRFIRELKRDHHIKTQNIILSLEKSSILELLEAREIFEVKIAELAAYRATHEDLKLLEEVLNGKYKEKNFKDKEKMKSDSEFHLAVSKAAHNFVFTNIIKLHLDLLRKTRAKTWLIPGRKKEQQQEHQTIFRAIKAGDAKKAGEAMYQHLMNVRKTIINV